MGIILGVTSDTVTRRTFVHTVLMTSRALNLGMTTIKRETCGAMIKVDILPCSRSMTASAVRAELSTMWVFGSVTRVTIRCGSLVHAIAVTRRTRDAAVSATQGETGSAVIEVDIFPITWVMTVSTVISHLPGVNIFMTGGAIGRRVLEQHILMAAITGNSDVLTHQVECSRGMVKINFLPVGGFVAGFAVLSQRAFMRIIRFMARETIHRCAFEHIVDMAAFASNIHVPR